ncbi:MAG: metal ABC transporter ATP-binding protein [Candidatus Aminicenantes bacterium]|nr:metal ABC transporter ATP-binding protein [Candidatus Aminicenantes bacterium]
MDSVAADPPLVQVRGVSFGYDRTPVILDVSLEIGRGDFLALLGPNGSGKTTLVKLILGLLRPEQGEIRLLGQPLAEFDDWHRVGYVPQKATHIDPLFPASVGEVVSMALRSRRRELGLSRRDLAARLEDALRLVALEAFRRSPINSLSGGQQQRVFIARALATRPDILFLDEPTTGVDAETRGRFYEMLDHLNKDHGITIVLVTHDIGIVDRHVNRVACLNQRLSYHGSHEEFCRSDAFRKMLDGDHVVAHEH